MFDKLKLFDKLKPKNGFLSPFELKKGFKNLNSGRFHLPLHFNAFTEKSMPAPGNIANDAETLIAKGVVLLVELLNARKIDQTVFFLPQGSKVTKPLLSRF